MNDFNVFSDAERVAMARIAHANESARIDDEMKRRERVERERESIKRMVEDNREEMAEQAQRAREQQFIAEAEIAFFKANPGASESDFKRLLPKIKDEFLLDNFRGVAQFGKSDTWDSEMQ